MVNRRRCTSGDGITSAPGGHDGGEAVAVGLSLKPAQGELTRGQGGGEVCSSVVDSLRVDVRLVHFVSSGVFYKFGKLRGRRHRFVQGP